MYIDYQVVFCYNIRLKFKKKTTLTIDLLLPLHCIILTTGIHIQTGIQIFHLKFQCNWAWFTVNKIAFISESWLRRSVYIGKSTIFAVINRPNVFQKYSYLIFGNILKKKRYKVKLFKITNTCN